MIRRIINVRLVSKRPLFCSLQQQQRHYESKTNVAKNVGERMDKEQKDVLKGSAETEEQAFRGEGNVYNDHLRTGRGLTTDQTEAIDSNQGFYDSKVFSSQETDETIDRTADKRKNMTQEDRDRIRAEMETRAYDEKQVQYSTEFRDTYQDEALDKKNPRRSSYASDRTYATGLTSEQKVKEGATNPIEEDFTQMKEDIDEGEKTQRTFQPTSGKTLVNEKLRGVDNAKNANTEPIFDRSPYEEQTRTTTKKKL